MDSSNINYYLNVSLNGPELEKLSDSEMAWALENWGDLKPKDY